MKDNHLLINLISMIVNLYNDKPTYKPGNIVNLQSVEPSEKKKRNKKKCPIHYIRAVKTCIRIYRRVPIYDPR